MTNIGVDIVGMKVDKRYMQGEGGDQNKFDVFCYSLGWIFHSTSSAGWINLGNRRSNLLFHTCCFTGEDEALDQLL